MHVINYNNIIIFAPYSSITYKHSETPTNMETFCRDDGFLTIISCSCTCDTIL